MSTSDEWVPVVDGYGTVKYIKHKKCNFTGPPSIKDRCKRCPKCGTEMASNVLEKYSRKRDRHARMIAN